MSVLHKERKFIHCVHLIVNVCIIHVNFCESNLIVRHIDTYDTLK